MTTSTSGDYSDNSSEKAGPSKPKKYKYRKKKFDEDWLKIEEFQGWLEKIPNDIYKCRCSACNVIITYGKSELHTHSKGTGHIKKVKFIKTNQQCKHYFVQKNEDQDKQVRNFEIRLSMFFLQSTM
jgi:hypothetical protein